VAQFLIYPKGAYILHMLRMMMYDPKQGGDARFQAMMKDFVQTYFNRDVSTEDFKSIVEKHITPEMDATKNGKMDWFFSEWVYGTEVPSYRMEYQATDVMFSGRSPNQVFPTILCGMIVPIYLDFGKGWVRLGTARMIGNTTIDVKNIKLPVAPKSAALCAMNDVLAVSIQNSK
jgi:hypothetical protein